jgi:hypothetical protein
MVKSSHRVRRTLKGIISDESLDLYILAVTALIFTILGISGISSITDLAAVILALLAALALSQIRSRRHVAAIANAQHADPLSLFSASFPPGLTEQRALAADLLLIGMTMSRTVQGSSREDLRRVLLRGGRIRVLLLDPFNGDLLAQAVSKHGTSLSPQRLKARILGTLDELTGIRDSTGGHLEIRVAPFALTMGINAIDAESADGILVAQHYEHRPREEAAPIVCLKSKDGLWFTHFLAEAVRMWEDGAPWPPSPAQALARSARPVFQESFGAELEQRMSQARDLLITGVARNTLLTSNYGKFETWLRSGCRIRFLLIDPSADTAVFYAADRYYAERSPDSLRERIRHSLRLLDELQHATGGALTVQLTSYPLAAGIIAVDSTPALRSGTSAVFVEYYTYQAAGEPKFILTTADGRWYDNLLCEAEALWRNAADHPRSARDQHGHGAMPGS